MLSFWAVHEFSVRHEIPLAHNWVKTGSLSNNGNSRMLFIDRKKVITRIQKKLPKQLTPKGGFTLVILAVGPKTDNSKLLIERNIFSNLLKEIV